MKLHKVLFGSREVSAGIVLYRYNAQNELELLIAHPGGPFFKNKTFWTFPKGHVEKNEEIFQAAIREFSEETGHTPQQKNPINLGTVTLKSGKIIFAWGLEGNMDPSKATSNIARVEFPKGSGTIHSFPEIDKVMWVKPDVATKLLNPNQAKFVVRLLNLLTT